MIHEHPAELLQRLIQFDTTNPPGNEAECLHYIEELIQAAGLETTLLGRSANRPNLIARLPGRGEAPPLLLQGHVDVVTTAGQEWIHPPFGGEIHDGYVWGRGALDMKGGVAMMICALLTVQASGSPPAGDIILCLMSDEEAGAVHGARYLVSEHPEQFEGVRHGIGEFGGFPLEIGGTTFYPIQVAERVGCQLEVTIRGKGGHGALPLRGGAMGKLGRILSRLDTRRTPIHITPVTRMMVGAIAENTSPPTSLIMRGLLNPRLTDRLIRLLGERLKTLEPVFRNTVNATVVKGGHKTNVVPSEITLQLDGRMLPGWSPEKMIAEVRDLIGEEVEIRQIGRGMPQPLNPDMSLFPLLADILREQEPTAVPIPFMLPAVTDGRYFSQLGIQHYGFLPLNLPKEFNFSSFIHSANERVPVQSLHFGTRAFVSLLQRYRLS
ncbi:MAG: M20/M25/M40 family metallo-hydrolase [Ardenticatenaceae bacterium]